MAKAKTEKTKGQTIMVDGVAYNSDDLTAAAKEQLANIRYCDEQIHQRRNEWAVADTARIAYSEALKREVS